MRKQIRLLLIISAVLFVGLLTGKTEIKAQEFCGVDQGYDASIGVNAKKCFKNWNNTWSCNNNGAWECNGTYSCSTSAFDSGYCGHVGHYSTIASDCYVNVYARYTCTFAACKNDCNIPADESSCVAVRKIEQGGCWVTEDGSASPAPSSEPSPQPNDPKGWHDGSSCDNSGGWTCDADSYSTPLTVEFYADGLKGTGSRLDDPLNPVIADVTREAAVASNCGGNADHGFGFTTPNSLKDGLTHCIYAYAINIGAGSDRLLPLSGTNLRCFTCAATTGKVQGRKIMYPGYPTNTTNIGLVEIEPAISQTVTLSGDGTANNSPYYFNNITAGSKTVSVSAPAGYDVVSTLCYNRIGCHTDACAAVLPLCPEGDVRGCANDPICTGGAVNQSGSTRTVDVPAGGYVDLWWHYTRPTCSVILSPGSASVEIGKTQLYTATVYPDPPSATVDRVDFSSGDTGVATVNPASDLTSAYQTTAKGENAGPTLIKANVFLGGGSTCPDTANITVTNPGPWWQVEAGNIHADSGNVRSSIPSTAALPYLITGSQPGLVSYTGGLDINDAAAINQAGLSNWQAQTGYQGLKTGYGYFKRILEDDPLDFNAWDGGQPGADGVYAAEGDMATLEALNITNEIIVILVNGDVSIDYDISVAEGGFLAIISSGNITIGNEVTNVEGVYVADGIISSGTSESQLIGEGIFTGWGGISLQRDFG